MKDRYLFKGKRVNGGYWVQSMTISEGNVKTNLGEIFFEIGEGNWIGVEPATVCQCTGLKDKNGKGKLSFAGDIIIYGGYKFIIDFDEELMRWRKKPMDFKDASFWGLNKKDSFEIIGNIHEELLENEK